MDAQTGKKVEEPIDFDKVWGAMSIRAASCLISARSEMKKLFDEYKAKGTFTDTEIFCMLFSARLKVHSEEVYSQATATIEMRRIINDLNDTDL